MIKNKNSKEDLTLIGKRGKDVFKLASCIHFTSRESERASPKKSTNFLLSNLAIPTLCG